MTVKEFNEKYYIEAENITIQDALISHHKGEMLLNYNPSHEVAELMGYSVKRKEDDKLIFHYETDDEEIFFEYLKDQFDLEI